MRLSSLLFLCALIVCTLDIASGKKSGSMKKGKKGMSTRMMCMMKYNALEEHYNTLRTRVDTTLSNPVHVHVHGMKTDKGSCDGDQSGSDSNSESMEDEDLEKLAQREIGSVELEHNQEPGGEAHAHEHRRPGHHHHMRGPTYHMHDRHGRGGKSSKKSSKEGKRSSGSKKSKSGSMEMGSSESSEDDSGSGLGSSEEGWGRKSGGTHVHIHLNVGAEVAEVIAQRMHGHSGEGEHVHTHTIEHAHGSGESHEHGELEVYPDEYAFASCDMMRNSAVTTTHNIRGPVLLRQKPGQPLEVKLDLYGFDVRDIRNNLEDPRHLHGFHVHQFGDFSNGCNSFGGHFNPDGHAHGGPDHQERHVGDWGNIECDHRGVVRTSFNESSSTLFGRKSIVGRGLVIHAHADDHGLGDHPSSKASGNAGGRVACCVISWVSGTW